VQAIPSVRSLPDWLYGYGAILDSINAQLDQLEKRAEYLLAPVPEPEGAVPARMQAESATIDTLTRLEYRLLYLSNRIDAFQQRLIV
jgi:hypothetical protein